MVFNYDFNINETIFNDICNKSKNILKVNTNNIVIDLTDINAKIGDIVKLDVNPMMVRPDIERYFD